MNKFYTIALAAAALSAGSAQAQDYSLTTSVGWESMYIFRGVELAQENFVASAELAVGDFYAGIWTSQPSAGATSPTIVDPVVVDGELEDAGIEGGLIGSEVDFYLGYGIAVSDVVSIDVGATLYYYPETTSGDETTFETYVGAAFDTMLSPALYIYYDWDLENLTIEGSIGYSIEVADNTSVDLGAFIGFVDLDSPLETTLDMGTPDDVSDDELLSEDTYTYIGFLADLVYTINETASTSLGIRYSYNSEDDFEGNSDEFWFGGSIVLGF
jgi:uncharacterized protein (TIGR02001 family)